MRRNKTYPKNNDAKLRETIKQLKAQVSRLRKENQLLRQGLDTATEEEQDDLPPEAPKKKKEPESAEEWRREFVKSFRKGAGPENKRSRKSEDEED